MKTTITKHNKTTRNKDDNTTNNRCNCTNQNKCPYILNALKYKHETNCLVMGIKDTNIFNIEWKYQLNVTITNVKQEI